MQKGVICLYRDYNQIFINFNFFYLYNYREVPNLRHYYLCLKEWHSC